MVPGREESSKEEWWLLDVMSDKILFQSIIRLFQLLDTKIISTSIWYNSFI